MMLAHRSMGEANFVLPLLSLVTSFARSCLSPRLHRDGEWLIIPPGTEGRPYTLWSWIRKRWVETAAFTRIHSRCGSPAEAVRAEVCVVV